MNIPVFISTSDTLHNIRCVKAERKITKGELIESCPIILIPKNHLSLVEQTVFDDYKYEWDENQDCMVLGYCILTNHSYHPNAEYKHNMEAKRIEYYALRDIEKDEEVTVNYNGDPEDSTPVDDEFLNFSL